MPDADDFDVEYLRRLLAGEGGAGRNEPAAAASPAAGRKPRSTPGLPAARGKGKKKAAARAKRRGSSAAG